MLPLPLNITQLIKDACPFSITQSETDEIIARLKQKSGLEFFEANGQVWIVPMYGAKPLKMYFEDPIKKGG